MGEQVFSPRQNSGGEADSSIPIKQDETSVTEHPLKSSDIDSIPDVVLRTIFQKLLPEDKITFSRSHAHLHDCVAYKRTEFLAHEIVPKLIQVLPKQGILLSRQLCKSWNRAVNYQLDQTQMRFRNLLATPDNSRRKLYFPNVFETVASIERFLDDMAHHKGNPFLDKTVKLLHNLRKEDPSYDLKTARIDYLLQSVRLLQKFGSHVHSFTFGSYYPVSTFELVSFLRNCLMLLPNLRQLNIFQGAGRNMVADIEVSPDFLNLHPFPRFEYLEEIFVSGVDPIIIREILSSCPNPAKLKTLMLRNVWLDPSWEFPESVFNFMNLELLEAEICMRDFQRFSSRTNVPPLKVLHWYFPQIERGTNPSKILRAVEPFHRTLANFNCSGIMDGRWYYNPTWEKWDLTWAVSNYNLPNLTQLCLFR